MGIGLANPCRCRRLSHHEWGEDGLPHLLLDVLLALQIEDRVQAVEVRERPQDLADVLLAVVAQLLVLFNQERLQVLTVNKKKRNIIKLI